MQQRKSAWLSWRVKQLCNVWQNGFRFYRKPLQPMTQATKRQTFLTRTAVSESHCPSRCPSVVDVLLTFSRPSSVTYTQEWKRHTCCRAAFGDLPCFFSVRWWTEGLKKWRSLLNWMVSYICVSMSTWPLSQRDDPAACLVTLKRQTKFRFLTKRERKKDVKTEK